MPVPQMSQAATVPGPLIRDTNITPETSHAAATAAVA
jgi:hypothetical protein